MNINKQPYSDRFDVQNAPCRNASQLGGIEVKSWEDVQRLVRMGNSLKGLHGRRSAGGQLQWRGKSI